MDEYGQLLPYFSGWIRESLEQIPAEIRKKVQEIRLRLGQPVALKAGEEIWFLNSDGILCRRADRCPKASRELLKDCLRKTSGYSVQSCGEELSKGFLTLPGGHRVGVTGTAAAEKGHILDLKQADSFNFRIARQIPGSAGNLPEILYQRDKIPSVLLAGIPGSGKTTVLRDLICRISKGEAGRPIPVAAVDERGELGGGLEPSDLWMDLGPCTDLLRGYPKGEGMEIALRTLSPKIIACDELGNSREVEAALQCMGAGVAVLTAVHGSSLETISSRPALHPLFYHHLFDAAVLIQDGRPCEIHWFKENFS